ncbi:MAG: phospholipase D family protein [Chloroflexota bacterium]|nr:phospholipase D family protein [Chloroflexota bacterium]
MVGLLSGPWRSELAGIASAARESILVVAPFIKEEEARWFCEQLRPGIEVITLANINTDAISASALDLAALRHLAEASPTARLVALSNLHAKVFVADETAAIVTSGNLTQSALDRNIEYGVLLREPDLVRTVRADMLSFERLGSRVDATTLADLSPLETELREARASVSASAPLATRRRFNEALRQARPAFASVQVGDRSAHAVFGDAIQFVLDRGPQTTKEIEEEVRQLLPDLCDDTEYFFIKGVRYGKTWKRRLRHAQQHLKRRGIVAYEARDRTWFLVREAD